MTANARTLRKQMTDAERLLWWHLRHGQLGFQFRRQAPIGRYIVDFACFEAKLVIELDGSQHLAAQHEDLLRDTWLTSQGFKVLRFWNNHVFIETEAVLAAIQQALPPPHPSPIKGGG
jgi:very-short-patch-repair endonuclease